MKIRNGFVSNSSSSSFCLYGINIDIKELYFGILNSLPLNKRDEFIEYVGNVDEVDSYEIDSYLRKNDRIVSLESGYDDEYHVIGISTENIPEDMTLNDLKIYLKHILNGYGLDIKTDNITWHEDCWMDN